MTNFLVSSAGRRGHLVSILQQVAQATGGGCVVAMDASPLAAAGLLADKFEGVPRVHEAGFADRVLEICEQYSIDVVVPTIDPELPVYAKARVRFENRGHTVWISSPEVVALGSDKWLFHNWLIDSGLASPATARIGDAEAAFPQVPIIAKPRGGSSSIGLISASSVTSLRSQCLTDDYIIQEQLAGYEVTVDFSVDRANRLLGMSARRRLEVRAGEVSKAVTIDHSLLRKEVERLVAALPGAFGVLNVQLFVDDDAESVHFIELNPRFGGGYPLSWQAGARFPLALLDAPGRGHRTDARPGVVMLRYDQAVFGDAAYFGDALP